MARDAPMKVRIQHSNQIVMVQLLDDFDKHSEKDFEDSDKVATFFIDKDNAKELADLLMNERRRIILENLTNGELDNGYAFRGFNQFKNFVKDAFVKSKLGGKTIFGGGNCK